MEKVMRNLHLVISNYPCCGFLDEGLLFLLNCFSLCCESWLCSQSLSVDGLINLF
jgi:hypothetical protein